MYEIDDLNRSIEKLFSNNYKGSRPFDISFAVPNKNYSPVSSDRPTLNFFLFDLRRNSNIKSTNSSSSLGKIVLSYRVSAWSPAQEDSAGTKTREEHRLLSEALKTLLKYENLPAETLCGTLKKNSTPPSIKTAAFDSMENNGQFWSAIEGILKPFIDMKIVIEI